MAAYRMPTGIIVTLIFLYVGVVAGLILKGGTESELPQGPVVDVQPVKPVQETAPSPPPVQLVTRSNSNLRVAPSIDAERVMVVPLGTTVTLVGREGNWRQVSVGETTGWVHRENFVSP